jgi:hypothetical protein
MKTPPIYLLPLVVAVAMLIQPDARGQVANEPPRPPACEVLQIDRLVGGVSLSLGIDRGVTTAMSCFLKLWREDQGGGTKSVLSNAFLSVMEQNPQRFFSIMSDEPKAFGEWMDPERLQGRSFSWPFDPPCGLETKRKQLISILRQATISGNRESELKNTVIGRLSAIRCLQLQ